MTTPRTSHASTRLVAVAGVLGSTKGKASAAGGLLAGWRGPKVRARRRMPLRHPHPMFEATDQGGENPDRVSFTAALAIPTVYLTLI